MKDHETEIKEQLINERENRIVIDQYTAWHSAIYPNKKQSDFVDHFMESEK